MSGKSQRKEKTVEAVVNYRFMKTAAVLLNYNDADATIEAVGRIGAYACLDTVIVVDNASTDDSAERIRNDLRARNRALSANTEQEPEGPFHRYMLVEADRNGGYGYGNNLGVRYAYEIVRAELVLIANPDTVFSEECAERMIACFSEEDVAAVSAVMQTEDGIPLLSESAWPLRSFLGELFHSCPLLRRIFKTSLHYPEAELRGSGAHEVDVVHGALLMVDADRFMACEGYDEEMFLYGEENVLAFKLREMGCRTMLLRDTFYTHKGSGTISKTNGAAERQRMRQKSELYYYRKYLEAGKTQQLIARILHRIVLIETRLFLKQD